MERYHLLVLLSLLENNMGSDDLFHKRKARSNEENKRRKASRKPYDRVLIVCEGEKTEPFYFEELRENYELDTANIEIDGSGGSSPINVVTYAQELFEKDKLTGEIYNKIYCVFDRDSHTSYDEAILKVKQINRTLKKEDKDSEVTFSSSTSIPSFEYWLLLHFTPTTKPYERAGRKSAGDLVIDDLRKYLPNYKKTQKGIFQHSTTDGTLDHAMAHSKRIYASAKQSGHQNPSTNIHELVGYLQNLKLNP